MARSQTLRGRSWPAPRQEQAGCNEAGRSGAGLFFPCLFFSSCFSGELAQTMQLQHQNLNKQIKGICLELAAEQNSCSR